jgi:ankyrin repeat protein
VELLKQYFKFSMKNAKDAIKVGAWEILDLLIKDLITSSKGYMLDAGEEQTGYQTILHYACSLNQPECARILLEHGASPNVKGAKNLETPLHLAARSGVECLQYLLNDQVSFF